MTVIKIKERLVDLNLIKGLKKENEIIKEVTYRLANECATFVNNEYNNEPESDVYNEVVNQYTRIAIEQIRTALGAWD